MASRKIEDLIPAMQDFYIRFAEKMEAANVLFVLTCTKRSSAEQAALYAQGREPLASVNTLRHGVGLTPITEAQNRRQVTWTMKTKHVEGKAFDIAIMGKDKKAVWDVKADVDVDGIPDYLEAALIGREVGLKCGADFKDKKGNPRPDYPHFELMEA